MFLVRGWVKFSSTLERTEILCETMFRNASMRRELPSRQRICWDRSAVTDGYPTVSSGIISVGHRCAVPLFSSTPQRQLASINNLLQKSVRETLCTPARFTRGDRGCPFESHPAPHGPATAPHASPASSLTRFTRSRRPSRAAHGRGTLAGAPTAAGSFRIAEAGSPYAPSSGSVGTPQRAPSSSNRFARRNRVR